MSQENVEVVRLAFEAFDRGDRAAFARLLAPDVEWHSLAGPLIGVATIRGREAMLRFLWEDIPEGIESFRAVPDEFTDIGNDRVLVGGRFQGRGRSSDVEVNMRVASIYEIRDGLVAAVRDYGSRSDALGAAGLRE
jgi:2-(1,2-epoxy-1,2-dihydrophenyl)acetyl-CoA isomerase